MAACVTIGANSIVSTNHCVSVYHDHESELFDDMDNNNGLPVHESPVPAKGLKAEREVSPNVVNGILSSAAQREELSGKCDKAYGKPSMLESCDNSSGTPLATSPYATESVMSMQEMFNSDSPRVPINGVNNGRGMSVNELIVGSSLDVVTLSPLTTPPSADNRNGLQVAINNYHETSRNGTPPVSLHTSTTTTSDQIQSQTHSQISSIYQIMDPTGNLCTSSTSASVSISSSQQGGRNNNSISHSGGIGVGMRPVLYSAIGSLETCGATSLGSLNKRYMASGGPDFNRGPVPSHLLPPKGFLVPITTNGSKKSQFTDSQNKSYQDSDDDYRKSDADTSDSQNASTSTNNRNGHFNNNGGTSAHNNVDNNSSSNSRRDLESHPPGSDDRTGKSNLQPITRRSKSGASEKKAVTIDEACLQKKKFKKPKPKPKSIQKPIELFRPSCDAYTPRMEKKKITYKPAEMRTPVQSMATPMGTLSKPNFRDALRRVAMLIHQHIVKIERRFEAGNRVGNGDGDLFKASMRDIFCEDNYATPLYKCTVVRVPMARPGIVCGQRKIKVKYEIPSEEEIYEFAHRLFKAVQLSSECSIVCLIYVERLMEVAKVPLLSTTWRPIFMCGLLLASKVWQDLSSWNIEFASVYPRFSLDSINRLELQFLRYTKWDLYISSSLYAKYYFALRSLVEKMDFRQRYNRMVGGVGNVNQSEALKIQKRTEQVKEEALLQLSRSM